VHAGSGERVLIVEDDDRVRRLTARHLRDLGYCVLEAGHGAEALAILAEAPDVEIVFSDPVMPGSMSGFDLAREVRKRFPPVRVILTSGYSAELMNQADTAQLDLQGAAQALPSGRPRVRVPRGAGRPLASGRVKALS
jgi:CheY-like chemotaxis protein